MPFSGSHNQKQSNQKLLIAKQVKTKRKDNDSQPKNNHRKG